MSAAQPQGNAGSSDGRTAKQMKTQMLVEMAVMDLSLQNFQRANADLAKATQKFSGDMKDFDAITAAATLWSQAKLQHRGDIKRVYQPRFVPFADDEDVGEHLLRTSRAVYDAQLPFDMARKLLDSYAKVDEAKYDAINKVFAETEREFDDVRINFDIFSTFNIFCL